MNPQGNAPLKYIWEFAGNPMGVSTSILNPPLGALVIDNTSGNIFRKTTPYGNNSGFSVVGNATVPSNAAIQPPQAFVDAMQDITEDVFSSYYIDLSNRGLTYCRPGDDPATGIISYLLYATYTLSTPPTLKLNGNAITNTNEILANFVALTDSYSIHCTVDLSGGTNAAPTGQGITDKATLIGAGWTVTTN